MAIKIPIITVFDSKGLRQAQFQLNKVSGNVSNLSRNFAIAGGAFAAVAVGLGKSVKVASDLSESVNAVNVAFGKSAKGILDFGKTTSTTLGISSLDFNNAAVRFSAFAERIVGSGNDTSGFIKEISTRAADFASVFNIDVSEALAVFQSGLAGEAEPLKRFGVNLLDTEVKAFAVRTEMIKQGETLTEQQKVLARYGLLMEATAKTQGDFANTSDGLANGLRRLQAQITDTQGEIGMVLLPVLEQILPVVRTLVSEFGDKLKVAVANVDFEAFITSIMNTVIFLVEHIETITKVVTALFLLNTAYNVVKITAGLVNAATTILGNTFVITAGKIGLATGAVKLFRTALITTGIGALVVGLGFIIEAIIKTNNAAEDGEPKVTSYLRAINKSGKEAEWAGGKFGIATNAIKEFNAAASVTPLKVRQSAADIASSFGGNAFAVKEALFKPGEITPDTPTGGAGGATATPARETFAQVLNKGRVEQNRTDKLMTKGLSEGAAALALSTVSNKKQFTRLISNLSKPGVLDRRQAAFNQSAAGKSELASIQANNDAIDAANDAIDDARAAQAAAEAAETAAREKAILDEKKRVYEAFANSVIGVFQNIRDSIMSAFSLPQLGGSTDSIIRNMDKLLTRVKAFSANITKLSSMGLDPKLLQQVINAGPIAGAKLAANLVSGGVSGLTAINAGFSELGNVAGEIGMTGTQSLFNNAAQQAVYNVTVNGGLDSGATIGKAVVDAIRAYERTSGPVFQGA